MKNLNKAIAIICLTAVMICIGYRIKARADDIPWAPEVLQNIGAGDMTGIGYAFSNLTSEQKTIACYLIGAYNNIYLMARGFSYSIPANETSWKAQFIALGNKVWQYATTAHGWKSRFNETFRQYLSSVCVYAAGINTNFDTWYSQNTGTGELYIPYSEEAFSAWTEFYNDPSGDGIASFGSTISSWNSGNFYDFGFNNYPWWDSSHQNTYNNFILNNNPVLFTSVENSDIYSGSKEQLCIGAFEVLPDALFIQRDSVTKFRFGFSDPVSGISSSSNCQVCLLTMRADRSNKITAVTGNLQYRYQVYTANGTTTQAQLIQYAFNYTPIVHYYNGVYYSFYYPYINHVFLVDDINNLSNPEEIYNTDSLNIVAPATNREPYILAPNNRLLFPTRPVGYDDPLGFWDIVIDNSVDDNGDPATDDDFHQQIVNNTTINNYYVTNDDRINVPVEWFENDLTDQLANDSIPFLTFARDCIDTLGDLQIYLYGAIVFGLGGGILKKFIL